VQDAETEDRNDDASGYVQRTEEDDDNHLPDSVMLDEDEA